MTDHSPDVQMVDGYPDGRDWHNVDQALLTEGSYRDAAKRIMMLPIPARDPAIGTPIHEWINAPSSVDAGLKAFRDALR